MSYVYLTLILLALAILAWYLLERHEPGIQLEPSYDGLIEEYRGDKTLLVAVHARWASVWPLTAQALSQIDRSQYDLKLLDADKQREEVRKLGVEVVPVVIVYRDGQELKRLPNMISLEALA